MRRSTGARVPRPRTWSPTPFEQQLAEQLIDLAQACKKRVDALETRIASLEADLVAERSL